jgi:hypothetical protein
LIWFCTEFRKTGGAIERGVVLWPLLSTSHLTFILLNQLPLQSAEFRSQIHECSISLSFLGIILRVLRLEVSEYNFHITNQFQTTFAGGLGGVVEVTVNSKEETLNRESEFGKFAVYSKYFNIMDQRFYVWQNIYVGFICV